MCHQPPGTDVCNTFKSSLMRGRFIGGAERNGLCGGCEMRIEESLCRDENDQENSITTVATIFFY